MSLTPRASLPRTLRHGCLCICDRLLWGCRDDSLPLPPLQATTVLLFSPKSPGPPPADDCEPVTPSRAFCHSAPHFSEPHCGLRRFLPHCFFPFFLSRESILYCSLQGLPTHSCFSPSLLCVSCMSNPSLVSGFQKPRQTHIARIHFPWHMYME